MHFHRFCDQKKKRNRMSSDPSQSGLQASCSHDVDLTHENHIVHSFRSLFSVVLAGGGASKGWSIIFLMVEVG